MTRSANDNRKVFMGSAPKAVGEPRVTNGVRDVTNSARRAEAKCLAPASATHPIQIRIVGVRNLPAYEFARGFLMMFLASTLTFAIGLTVYGIVQGLLP